MFLHHFFTQLFTDLVLSGPLCLWFQLYRFSHLDFMGFPRSSWQILLQTGLKSVWSDIFRSLHRPSNGTVWHLSSSPQCPLGCLVRDKTPAQSQVSNVLDQVFFSALGFIVPLSVLTSPPAAEKLQEESWWFQDMCLKLSTVWIQIWKTSVNHFSYFNHFPFFGNMFTLPVVSVNICGWLLGTDLRERYAYYRLRLQ